MNPRIPKSAPVPATPGRGRSAVAVVAALALCACEAKTAEEDDGGAAGGQASGGQATGGQATGGQAAGGQAAGGQAAGGQATGGGLADSGPAPGDASPTDATITPADAALTPPDAAALDAGEPLSTMTGQPCADTPDCGEGYVCYTMVTGGYCLPGAPGGPTACREPEHGCPTDTVCSPLPWHQISGVCMLACDGPEDCREGYACAVVELFPGEPDSPHSAAPVCWFTPICQFGADQTCNDDPLISSIHGTCLMDGTCQCHEGYALNEETGRCL